MIRHFPMRMRLSQWCKSGNRVFSMVKAGLKLATFLSSLLLLLNWVVPTPEAGAQGSLDPRFGAVEAFWAPNEAAALGIGWERILFYWSQLQPFGPEDWNTLHVADEWLALASAQGRTVVGLLKNTPQWATDGIVASGVPRGLFLPVDDPGNLWATYARRVASYYGPRGVHHWVIWNEPDIAADVYGHEFGGTIQEYYQLLKVAYQAIKGVDPTATIHLGGLTHWHDPGYLRRFLQVAKADPEAAANGYFFDVISLHIYFRPETVPMIVGAAFAVQVEQGITPLKPVWINETNARPSMDPEWPVQVQAFHVDLEQQAWYLVQAYALGFYAGAARISVYKLVDINMQLGDESWGLVRPYDFSKRPAYFAYQNTIKYLAGFTYPLQREQASGYYIISFPRPQGLTRVLWARTTAPVVLSVPALAASATLVDAITDERTVIPAENGVYKVRLEGARCHQECLIGGPPLFLVEEGVAPSAIPTAVPPPVVAPTSTAMPSASASATVATTPSATLAPSRTATQTATPTLTETATPSVTPTSRPTQTATPQPTKTSTVASATATVEDMAGSETPISSGAPGAVAALVASPTTATALQRADNASEDGEALDWGSQASWWLIGAGLGLLVLLLVTGLRSPRRR